MYIHLRRTTERDITISSLRVLHKRRGRTASPPLSISRNGEIAVHACLTKTTGIGGTHTSGVGGEGRSLGYYDIPLGNGKQAP